MSVRHIEPPVRVRAMMFPPGLVRETTHKTMKEALTKIRQLDWSGWQDITLNPTPNHATQEDRHGSAAN